MLTARVEPPVLSEQEARDALDNYAALYALATGSLRGHDVLQAALSEYRRVQGLVAKLPERQPMFVLPGQWIVMLAPRFGTMRDPRGQIHSSAVFPGMYRSLLDTLGVVFVASALLQIDAATAYLRALADKGSP